MSINMRHSFELSKVQKGEIYHVKILDVGVKWYNKNLYSYIQFYKVLH